MATYRHASIDTTDYEKFEAFLVNEYRPTENLNLSVAALLTKATHDFIREWRKVNVDKQS